ncbi:U5 small nuclear ribonucleoprotein 40 kDa protein [Trifolium repens]|nr:U5 small nuclear ribonucleoprotein 40 kDa protein [Trifolium repens]
MVLYHDDDDDDQEPHPVRRREEQEQPLLALVEYHHRQVKKLRYYVSTYTTKLREAEEKLRSSESKLAFFQGKTKHHGSNSLNQKNETPSKIHHQSKPQTTRLPDSAKASINYSNYEANRSTFSTRRLPTEQDDARGTKRKFEIKGQKDLVPFIGRSSLALSVNCGTGSYISSLHIKRLRNLALCPVNDQHFVTSALDGVVRLWEVHSGGSRVNLISTTDCATEEQKRWPEDIAWHPDGKSLFSVYSADSQDSQVSVTEFKEGERSAQVSFLEDKPHVKGVINSIVFLPWENTCFATAGTDHSVMLWSENVEKKWKPEALHRNYHTSAVMGVAGVQHKKLVLSVGKDRRILAYNAEEGKQDFMLQVDSKCLSILPNPRDFNLFMVQTGTHDKQLRLFDIRLKQKEVHAFGWKQESSDTQSALVNQDWSPSGLYITSGSADPLIHIFDIRFNGHKPSQSIEAHKKRVFKAMWHKSLPLLISISSDLNIGLHKFM